MAEEYNLKDLLDEYTFQREQRVTSERAIELLNQLAPNLNDKDRHQLAEWIREWELSRPASPPPPEPPKNTSPATVPVRPENISDLLYTTNVLNVNCPHCGKQNPEGSKYCYACGQLLGTPVTAGKTSQLIAEVEDGAIFGKLAVLTLTVRGFEQQPIRVKVGDQPLSVGRSDPTIVARPDIDLEKFNGKDSGVSRLHAMIQRENQTLTLIDKGSLNHTYLNGEKVHAHEKRVVRDGDEIRFGRLTLRVDFQRELKRL